MSENGDAEAHDLGPKPAPDAKREETPALPGVLSARETDWLAPKTIVPVLQALLLFWLGWILTGRVTTALEKRKIEISAIKEMQQLVSDLQSPIDTVMTMDVALGKVAALALYGEYSIPVFVQLLDKPGDIVPVAAQSGLRFVAQQSPREVIHQMHRVLLNRTQVYGWRAHKIAVETLSELDEPDALNLLLRYRSNFPPDDPSRDSTKAGAGIRDSLWFATLRRMVQVDNGPLMRDATKLRETLKRGVDAMKDDRPMYLRP